MNEILYPEQKKYIDSLSSLEDELLCQMAAFAAERKIPILDKNSSLLLEQMIRISSPLRVLEIGTAIGFSAIRIARVLKEGAILETIEKSRDNIPLARNYINRSGYENKICLIEGNALEIMRDMKARYEFIFLDADKQDYMELLRLSVCLLNKGGILFVDNLLWHGWTAASDVPEKFKRGSEKIRAFNKAFLEHPGLKSAIYPVGDGIGIGIKE
jgi:predicted O-methyltransferase YrrM